VIIMYCTVVLTIRAWSWKKISCPVLGEAPSLVRRFIHVVIGVAC
jgi:hypothetical protein